MSYQGMTKPTTRSTKADLLRFLASAENQLLEVQEQNRRLRAELIVVPQRIARAENCAREWGMNEARALATIILDNRKTRLYDRLRRFFTW